MVKGKGVPKAITRRCELASTFGIVPLREIIERSLKEVAIFAVNYIRKNNEIIIKISKILLTINNKLLKTVKPFFLVRPSLNIVEIAHRFSLIFCMKLGHHKGTKVTEPDF